MYLTDTWILSVHRQVFLTRGKYNAAGVTENLLYFSLPGLLTFMDGGGGGGAHEGLFETNQLTRRESSHGAVHRAQAASAKARALPLWSGPLGPPVPGSSSLSSSQSDLLNMFLVLLRFVASCFCKRYGVKNIPLSALIHLNSCDCNL